MSGVRGMALTIASVVLAACAAPGAIECGPHERAMVSDRLFFGTSRAGGPPVSPGEWSDFLAGVVTPRFPDGFTTWSASGQWRSPAGIVREPSYVLEVVHPTGTDAEDSVAAIAQAYKARFRQESVLRVRAPACVAF